MLIQAFIAFGLAIIFVLVAIMKFKMHAFLALLLGALLMGLVSGLPLDRVAAELTTGFGNTMGGVGIIIMFGIIFGTILQQSGMAEAIADMILRRTGERNAPLAMALTGYVVSIPVFFDAAFVILFGLIRSISRKARIPLVTLVVALAIGLSATHAMVIPTPGPLAVAANMGADIPWMLFWSIIVSLPAALVGGVLYGKWLGRRPEYANDFGDAFADEALIAETVQNSEGFAAEDSIDMPHADSVATAANTLTPPRTLPSGGLGIFLILIPIILILAGTAVLQFIPEGTFLYQLTTFIGDRNIALLISAIIAYLVLRPYLTSSLTEIIASSAAVAAPILLITGAGGALGRMIGQSAIGTDLSGQFHGLAYATGAGTLLVIIGWFISQALRFAQGSTTVALITASAILGPIVADIPGAPVVLIAIAITAGGMGLSMPNDSGFWVVGNLARFDVKTTFRTWTAGLTIMGITALLITVVLSLFAGVLPGLH